MERVKGIEPSSLFTLFKLFIINALQEYRRKSMNYCSQAYARGVLGTGWFELEQRARIRFHPLRASTASVRMSSNSAESTVLSEGLGL
jgi:hypothetical protein